MLGRILAERLNRPFKDTDAVISNRLCQPISQFFQRYGEAAFREHETAVLQQLDPDGSVLATGGGIVLREKNWDEMKRLGTTVFLNVSPDVLIERLTESTRKRPLLQVENWHEKVHELLAVRMDLYKKADVIVEICEEEDPQSVIDRVIESARAQGVEL